MNGVIGMMFDAVTCLVVPLVQLCPRNDFLSSPREDVRTLLELGRLDIAAAQ